LEQLPQFVKKLRATDEVAVEVTSNTRLFYHAVAAHGGRVVVVNEFRVISQSVKKTDPNDARNLELYLAKGTFAGGAHERKTTSAGGQSHADARPAGESCARR
jgi:hypothetical protein